MASALQPRTSKRRSPPTRTCTYHCSGCGSHFSSLTAFDSHRQGSFDPPARHCEEPADVLTPEREDGLREHRLEAHRGECRLARPPEPDVLIWTERGAVARAMKAFR